MPSRDIYEPQREHISAAVCVRSLLAGRAGSSNFLSCRHVIFPASLFCLFLPGEMTFPFRGENCTSKICAERRELPGARENI